MDQPYSGNDVSLSPSQILERLQVLRQLQLLQRGKLQKQRLQYEETTETSSSITEIVSQFSNTTSYNTFRSLLQSSNDTSNDVSPRFSNSNITANLKEKDLVEGVSILNLSQESEFIVTSPGSTRSALPIAETVNGNSPKNKRVETNPASKKVISLDEMPILSPKQNFEAMLIEKLKNEKPPPKAKSPKKDLAAVVLNKKPFLRRGEGMSRFGIKKNDLVIQNTQSLPWRRKSLESRTTLTVQKPQKKGKVNVQIIVTEPKKHISPTPIAEPSSSKEISRTSLESEQKEKDQDETLVDSSNCEAHGTNKPSPKLQIPKAKHPLLAKKGKTWAAVLTKEQDEFLRQLKQSEYYKNFTSPAKSTISDMSCDNNMSKLRQEREIAEQNMFELLENKVCNESFHLENSFFSKFLRRSQLECSGESTPLIMKTCLASNPELLHIFPDIAHKNKNENTQLEVDSHNEYTETECDSDNCSSVCSCCSCKTIEPANITAQSCTNNKQVNKNANQKDLKINRKEVEKKSETELQDDSVTEVDTIKANMAEMNAKLIATSELLKDRLRELEDEIETFRKENVTLAKMREEIELERQKFYEEKNTFQQKFNEEKILSEYYLAEEKEKLTKQRQMYERYVKDMRGRLNKKEKDEILNLKKEISDLKEEIRNKDAKTTSTIARLRNQLKIMEKEKKDLQDQVEKLKKENRRIQHSNDITRRLSNMKYLEEINKKLSHMSSKETQSAVELDSDTKYKVHEIERQSRSRKIPHVTKSVSRPRAKSVPNLNVTSRYAKYFSQRDTVSQMDRDKMLNDKDFNTYCTSDNSINNSMDNNEDTALDDTESIQGINLSNETENHLEKIYMERFQSTSPVSNRSSFSNPHNSNSDKLSVENSDNFFLHKSNSSSNSDSKTPNHSTVPPYQNSSSGSNTNRSKSPISILNHKSSGYKSPRGPTLGNYGSNIPDKSHSATLTCAEVLSQISKSPVSILSNRSSGSLRPTVIDQDQFKDKLALSPEPSTSKTSLTKTNLNPTEIKKSDGSRELRFPNGNVKHISADGKYTKFVYYNGDVKENFYNEGRIKYFYAEAKTCHTTHADGLEVLEFPDGQVEKRYKDGSTEIRLPNGSIRYFDPKNEHIREEWRFPDGTALTVSACGEQRIVFSNGQVEVHAKDHKRREFPDGTMKLVYNDGTSETRYASGRVRIKDKHGNLIMDSAPG